MKTPQSLSDLNWADLSVLLAAIEHCSLNRAAKALGIGQSTASRRLSRLEEQLGIMLFDRLPDGLRPTQFAIELQPHAELIAGHMQNIQRLASGQEGEPTGRVRLALPDGLASQWLLAKMQTFYAAYPKVDIDLIIGHAVVDLVRREADIALRFVPPTSPDLVVKKIAHISVGAFVHPSLTHIPVRDLRWIGFLNSGEEYVETEWVRTHIAPERTMLCSSWNTLFASVCHGLGAALLSPYIAHSAGLRPLQGLPKVPGRDLYLVYHSALRHVPRISALRTWLIEQAADFQMAEPKRR